MSGRPSALLLMEASLPEQLFDAPSWEILSRAATVVGDPSAADVLPGAEALASVAVLVTGWGSPTLDVDLLHRMPALRAVVHSAGTVKELATPESWDRGIVFSSAAALNAIPVAEYVVAAVLFSNKGVLRLRDKYRQVRSRLPLREEPVGNFRRVVGVVGASSVGRRVLELLRPYDFDLLLFDPFVDEAEARRLGARSVSLEHLCRESDVVTLHAPSLPETRGMIDRRMLAMFRSGATIVNTARGALVDTEALIDETLSGRLNAVLDTTEPEILPASSPLYDLPNVLLTPHIAGSLGNELRRLGQATAEEVAHFARTGSLLRPVSREQLARSA